MAAFDRLNIVMVIVSGLLSEEYRKLRPGQILASPLPMNAEEPVASLRAAFASGRYQALAEIAPQYAGLAPNDPKLEPYFALAEEVDVPVGIHMGPVPPGAAGGDFNK